ncbi:MAG: hypothetical protein ACR2P6_01420 [Gammaproteobacteria bacterium]
MNSNMERTRHAPLTHQKGYCSAHHSGLLAIAAMVFVCATLAIANSLIDIDAI